eukprot:8133348-Alexandrium_andersonii.AAC.1
MGVEIEVKRRAPTEKSVSFSCPCRACGRGEAACVRASEAAWVGERREPSPARARMGQMIPP